MKMAEFWKMVLVSSIIDFDDVQLWLRQFCLNLNICKVMTDFLIFLGQNLKKIVFVDASSYIKRELFQYNLILFSFSQSCTFPMHSSWMVPSGFRNLSEASCIFLITSSTSLGAPERHVQLASSCSLQSHERLPFALSQWSSVALWYSAKHFMLMSIEYVFPSWLRTSTSLPTLEYLLSLMTITPMQVWCISISCFLICCGDRYFAAASLSYVASRANILTAACWNLAAASRLRDPRYADSSPKLAPINVPSKYGCVIPTATVSSFQFHLLLYAFPI